MTKLGVYGGTFNPIHNAGMALAAKAHEQFQLDKVIFVPNGNPPHKQDVLDKEIRFEMVQAAIHGDDRFEVSRLEIDRVGPSWTIDTLTELKRLYGDAELFFLMGEDNVSTFASYDRRQEFFALARLAVAPRAFPNQSSLSHWRKLLPEATIDMIDLPASGLASREIRALVRAGGDCREHVPQRVYRIITDRKLYRNAA